MGHGIGMFVQESSRFIHKPAIPCNTRIISFALATTHNRAKSEESTRTESRTAGREHDRCPNPMSVREATRFTVTRLPRDRMRVSGVG